jgi:hypothetical protein
MLKSPLAQFGIICIILLFWGNNEIFLTNLSITAIGAVVIGYIIVTVFFNGQLIPRNYQLFLKSVFFKQQKFNLFYVLFVFFLFTILFYLFIYFNISFNFLFFIIGFFFFLFIII